jgi:hypothetical protein
VLSGPYARAVRVRGPVLGAILGIATASAAACGSGGSNNEANDPAAVERAYHAYTAAAASGDGERLCPTLTERARRDLGADPTLTGSPVHGLQAILAACPRAATAGLRGQTHREGPEAAFLRSIARYTDERARKPGAIAVRIAGTTATVNNAGIEYHGDLFARLRLEHGHWKVDRLS